MTDDTTPADADDERVAARAELLPEEEAVGSDDPGSQSRAILEDSEARQANRGAAPGATVEHRRSEDTVEPPG